MRRRAEHGERRRGIGVVHRTSARATASAERDWGAFRIHVSNALASPGAVSLPARQSGLRGQRPSLAPARPSEARGPGVSAGDAGAAAALAQILARSAGRTEDYARALSLATAAQRAGIRLLDIALDHLSLGRAHLLGAQRGTGGDLAQATSHLNQAVDGLRRAGYQDHLATGLLARAALHTHTHAYAAAHHDLEEALSLATRCEFRLHEADAHLAYTHLALAEGKPAAAQEHLAKAKGIVEKTGYHRRDEALHKLQALTPSEPPPSSSGASESVADFVPSIAPIMTTTTQPVTLGIVVALKEETKELLALVAPYTSRSDGGMNSYLFTRGAHTCVVTMVGAMGETEAARVTERQVAHFEPAAVITMGISGAVHEDLRVGDVFVPTQAEQYMQDGKATPDGKGGFDIKPGAPASRADNYLHTLVTGFDLNHTNA